MPQRSTCSGLRIRTPSDARTVFHAVAVKVLPMITRRLDSDERNLILPGNVYVWEERGASTESTGTGIERWTDGIRWGPSRVRDGFLFYQEKQDDNVLYSANAYRPTSSSRNEAARTILTKQTYTVNVSLTGATVATRKWHLIAYFTDAALDGLRTIDQVPELANLTVPHEKYQTARAVKGRPEHIFNAPPSTSGAYNRLEYVPYRPRPSTPTTAPSPLPSSSTPRFRRIASPPPLAPQPQQAYQSYSPQQPSQTYPPQQFHQSDSSSLTQTETQSSVLVRTPVPSLVPLAYLSGVSRPRRSPEDDRALRRFQTPARRH